MENLVLAFTLKSTELMHTLITDTLITSEVSDKSKIYSDEKIWKGLWDTGASKSSIDNRIAHELSLIPIGMEKISTANGLVDVNTYLINLTLPNKVTIENLSVTSSDLGDDVDLLIGMDVIKLGDFSITNTNKSTTFSFRIPSIEEINYVNTKFE